MKVEQFAPNHTIVETETETSLFSYQTKVVEIKNGVVYLDPKYKVSKTTSKRVNEFLGVDSKEREKRIKNGDYVVMPLN